MATILIADDDRVARNSFKEIFEAEGYAVRLAKDGAEAVRKFAEESPDLLLLDVMMPRMNGLAACAEIRRSDSITPILFITSMPSEISLVRGLGMGADDYIDKARSPEELLARVGAALRKSAAYEAELFGKDMIVLGRVTVNLHRLLVTEAGSPRPVELTRYEALLLRALNEDRGKFVDNDRLFSRLHGEAYSGDVSRIRSIVCNVKKKLGPAGDMIVNNRSCGYMLLA